MIIIMLLLIIIQHQCTFSLFVYQDNHEAFKERIEYLVTPKSKSPII